MRTGSTVYRPLSLFLIVFLLAFAAAGAQEIEEEDLRETELEQAPQLGGPQDDAALETLFVEAENVFFNAEDPAVARQAFDRVLSAIEARRHTGELSETARRLLLRALAYRAELYLEIEEKDAMEADLGRILELDPRAELDEDAVSAKLAGEFAKIRKERLGELRVTADPPDLELRIDGRVIPLAIPPPAVDEAAPDSEPPPDPGDAAPPPAETVVTLLAGIRLVEATRPGFAPLAQEIEITAGKETPVDLVLERLSAVVRLHTRPSGGAVSLDGVPYGSTSGEASESFFRADTLGRYRREEFSSEFLVPDVGLGLSRLTVEKEGYRPYRAELRIDELRDYDLPPIVLEEERGTLVLRDLPSGAELTVDGERTPSAARLALTPGEHHVQVTAGRSRMFSTRVRLADRQTIEVNVRLRPGLAFLGVLGPDSEDLERALRRSLDDAERWSLLDRAPEAREVLPKAGLTVESSRRAAEGEASAVDWTRVQTAVDAQAPGLVYLLAVVADDLLGAQADVWIWAASPGPAEPDRLRVDLGRPDEIDRLKEVFHRRVPLRRPWLGGLVLTTGAAPHPVIADVTPGGPLEPSGVRPGDLIVGIAGVPVFSGADVEARILAAETGEPIEVGVQTPGGPQKARVVLGASPLVHSEPFAGVPESIGFTDLLLTAERARPEEAWVIRLNQALILLRARDYEGAVRLLREIEAPEQPNGVGRAAVDYWLGVALANTGPTYRDKAVEAFRRAAKVEGARLDHHDGPWVAPRARARLIALGAGS